MPLIYHITHTSNLPGILREGALLCDAEAERRAACQQTIAYANIKTRRRTRLVEKLDGSAVAAGGVLPDYVPFYFSNRTPMLGAIHKGQVPGYLAGQREVIYLVSSTETVVRTPGLVWCFTDGHGAEAMTEFFDDLQDLPRVDWTAVQTWRWGGRWLLANPDVKRRKQAEFLVHERLPFPLVESTGVLDAGMLQQVRQILAEAPHQPRLAIETNWYFNL